MSRLEETPSATTRPRRPREVSPATPQPALAEEELSESAIGAIEEGRADHADGRTFTLAEVKRELGIEP